MSTYPYKATTPQEREAVNARIGQALVSVDAMIYQRARFTFPTAQEAEIEDHVQTCRIHLARVSLPRYSPDRSSCKVSSFLHTCIRRFMLGRLRYHRRPIRQVLGTQPLPVTLQSPDTAADRTVERLADAILHHPAKYGLSPNEEACLRCWDMKPPQAMRELGITHNTLSSLRYRTRQRVKEAVTRLLADAA